MKTEQEKKLKRSKGKTLKGAWKKGENCERSKKHDPLLTEAPSSPNYFFYAPQVNFQCSLNCLAVTLLPQ